MQYLENAIYCNNRNISDLGGWNPSGGSVTADLKFNDYNTSNLRLTCQDKEDQFTLKVESGGTLGYGNNALDYPVGLLTIKEVILARGDTSTNYLSNVTNNITNFWTLSPNSFSYRYPNTYYTESDYYDYGRVDNIYGVLPAVSLSKKVKLNGEGNGTIESPYILAPLD